MRHSGEILSHLQNGHHIDEELCTCSAEYFGAECICRNSLLDCSGLDKHFFQDSCSESLSEVNLKPRYVRCTSSHQTLACKTFRAQKVNELTRLIYSFL